MSTEQLTAILAERAMGWVVGPERFLLGGRRWLPRWRFRPLTELADAFQLIDRVADHYTLTKNGRTFTAQVRTGSGRGTASGEQMARTITLAVARALGMEVDSCLN